MTQPLPESEAHFAWMELGRMGESLHNFEISTGLGGRWGCVLFLPGTGLGRGTILPLTWTQRLGGN